MGLPEKQGLYDPRNEHDACGVGFVADIKGRKTHDIVRQGLQILVNLDHRGAVGADPLMGDGAGAMIQIPDALLRDWARKEGVDLPEPGHYAVAMCFLPQDEKARSFAIKRFEHFVKVEKQKLVGWRDVPTDLTGLGKAVIDSMPVIRMAIVGRGAKVTDQDAFERKLLTIRKQTQNPLAELEKKQKLPGLSQLYMPSFSSRTVVYKGLLLAPQVESFYEDLRNPLCESALCLVHQRFSTNTFPSWKLAHPYRFIAHNGEINTVRGNVNWMYARRRTMESDLIGADLDKMWPIIPHGQSDTACLDNALELLVAGGYSLSHAMMMLIPEAWAGNPLMDGSRKAFYEYHAALMEPWDGPASIAFTDGRQIGATLDRNGLRPARFLITEDDLVVMSSESGVLPIPDEKIVRKWRLQPGKMLLIDLEEGRIVEDEELKRTLAEAEPYEEWLKETQHKLEELSEIPDAPSPVPSNDPSTLLDRQQAFGYTQEDIKFFLEPMASEPDDPIGSMGTDTPIAVLSKKPKLLYNYFKQNFAQVTNPPIDPIREELVMSLVSMIGPRPNLLGRHAGMHKRLEVAQPILTNAELEKIRSIEDLLDGAFRTATIDTTWLASEGAAGLEKALDRVCAEATDAGAGRPQHPDPVGSRGVGRAHADPGAAGDRGRAPPPDPPGPAHPDRPRGRDRRGARGPSLLLPGGLRRRGDQSVPGLRDAGGAARPERPAAQALRGSEELHQGGRQGPAQGHVQDGHLDLPVLLRRADLRRGRPAFGLRREVLHRHRHHDRGRGLAGDRRGDGAPSSRRLRRQSGLPHHARCRRRLCLPPARRGACLDARERVASLQHAVRGNSSDEYKAFATHDQRAERAAADHPRPDAVQVGRRRRCRSRRSSRPRTSSSASPPAR